MTSQTKALSETMPATSKKTVFLQTVAVRKSFGTHVVLPGIDLHVDKGEMICILGPSGCGKTTLLRCIAGLEKPDDGSILLQGQDITCLAPEKRHFGFVFQNYALFPNLTVEDNIAYGLRGPDWPSSRRRHRVNELLEMMALNDHVRHFPGELSGGQQQRVALARALAQDPTLLLLDEPLSALDAQVRTTLREDLRKIQRQLGTTAILVTHDQQEALSLSDRIVVMHEGRIEQIANPDTLYQKPASRFVAEFIGAMNVLTLGQFNEGRPFGIRYEDILVDEATEAVLRHPDSQVARVESCRLLGSFHRLELLLNDQKTIIYADISTSNFCPFMAERERLVAVILPHHRWCRWEEP